MSLTKEHLNDEWKLWIKNNLYRKCTIESIVETMVNSGFNKEYSEKIVNICAETGDIGDISINEYIYGTTFFHDMCSYIDAGDRKVRVSLWNKKPLIVVLENVLSHEECEEIIKLSIPKLEKSGVISNETGESVLMNNVRSSSGTYFKNNENDFFIKLNERFSKIVNLPVYQSEHLQILNYQIGEQYLPHHDYFSSNVDGVDKKVKQFGQRVSTMVIYLNDVEKGGTTSFPEIGLSVMPKKGGAVYFEYCNSIGQLDSKTLHAGDPVIEGEKWVATKWMRDRVFAQ